MGKKPAERKKHSEEKSKNEIGILKDIENKALNVDRNADVSDMEMKKNEKRKKKKKLNKIECVHESEKAQIDGEYNERAEAANGSKTSLLVDGQEVESKTKKKEAKKKNHTSQHKNVGKKKKRKRDKDSVEDMVTNGNANRIKAGTGEEVDASVVNMIDSPRKERKKRKRKNDVGGEATPSETLDKNKYTRIVENEGEGRSNLSENSSLKKKSKRVCFVEDVEVFPLPGDEKAAQEDGLVRGKRFSHEEDEIIRNAVSNYIEAHHLGENGLYMILHCKEYSKEYPEIKNCWKEIGESIPWRPQRSVYIRAHNLFERDESHSWTSEELESLRKLQKKYGTDWKSMAGVLGKHRIHVKDTWRRICLPNMKKGKWSQEEYQNLFDLVNQDLRERVTKEKKSQHGMLRDNITWTAISNNLQTRADAICCMKWYRQLTSPMVSEGKWLDTDDFRLVKALYELDACCMEDVDWDDLVEHRSGEICRKRWNQMVKHLGDHVNKSFPDQVEILTKRYCPNLLELREAYDRKPVVD